MGFKLKIGLIYYVTSENIIWKRENIPLSELWFGVDFPETEIIREGKLSVKEVKEFYNRTENKRLEKVWREKIESLTENKTPRNHHPIIVIPKKQGDNIIHSVFDGNRRTAKALLDGKDTIETFVGNYTDGDTIRNYWIPTTILMELVLFAKQASDGGDKEMFMKYMEILKDIIRKSESAKYELKERSLTGSQGFKDEVLNTLEF